ncbi:MAG: hypothetical protein Edafosvirus3_13 [Edafosvirus sp.]|uniref:Uncharacterized protein n=1 Tax=Edafosvirus sp. TaxID=2487765 RepID=A0A3G4ZSR7_9VIRU|nr:MAG: hypothetical protein Edafosvirus3_13 [Edafosvirus sp.]
MTTSIETKEKTKNNITVNVEHLYVTEYEDSTCIHITCKVLNNEKQFATVNFMYWNDVESQADRASKKSGDYSPGYAYCHPHSIDCGCGNVHTENDGTEIELCITNGEKKFLIYNDFKKYDAINLFNKIHKLYYEGLDQEEIAMCLFEDLCLLIEKKKLVDTAIDNLIKVIK